MKVGQKSCTHQSFADPAYQIFELFKYAYQIFKYANQKLKYACQIFNYLNIQTKYSNFHTKYSAFETSIPNSHLLEYSYQIFGGFPDHFKFENTHFRLWLELVTFQISGNLSQLSQLCPSRKLRALQLQNWNIVIRQIAFNGSYHVLIAISNALKLILCLPSHMICLNYLK